MNRYLVDWPANSSATTFGPFHGKVVTCDQGIEYQQNLRVLVIGIIVVVAKTNTMADLTPLVPPTLRELSHIKPGQLLHVRA